MKLLPWWIVLMLFMGCHFVLKSLILSPCGVLGISSATKSSVSRAIRKISLCTHPDKFTNFSDKYRADILFKRVSTAQSRLTADTLTAKRLGLSPSCWYQETTEILEFVAFAVHCIVQGPWFVARLAQGEVEGFQDIFIPVLYVGLVWFTLKSIYYSHIYILLGLVMRPVPTLLRFVQTPFLRLYVFLNDVWALRVRLSKKDTKDTDDRTEVRDKEDTDRLNTQLRAEQRLARSAEPTLVHRRKPGRVSQQTLDQRVEEKKTRALLGQDGRFVESESEEDEEEEEDEVLPPKTNDQLDDNKWDNVVVDDQSTEEGSANADGFVKRMIVTAPMGLFDEERLLKTIGTKPRMMTKAMRDFGVSVVQFEFFLHLTKNIIPLITVALFGEAFNGLLFSVVIGWVVRRFPQMGYETLHLWCFAFGLAHTYLGLSASEIISKSEGNGGVIVLSWTWAFRDMITLAVLAAQGAIFAAATGMGNEPLFTSSFTAGIAARLWVYEWVSYLQIDGSQLLSAIGVDPSTLPFTIANEADASIRATFSIGSCGGGPLRALAGDYSTWAAFYVKLACVILPVLYTLQWSVRFYLAVNPPCVVLPTGAVVYADKPTTRDTVARGFLAAVGCLFTVFVLLTPFNAINS
eukprot:Ihof_evm9s26 gene=Ihof_evmTU9s26